MMNAAKTLFEMIDYDNTGYVDRRKLRKYLLEQMELSGKIMS